jgi:hypothetical protein
MQPTQTVQISQMQNSIIADAYKKFSTNGWPVSVNDDELIKIAAETSTAPDEIDSQVRQLIDSGLLNWGDTYRYHATWRTIDAYERNFLDDSVFTNNRVRRLLLQEIFKARTSESGYLDSDDVYSNEEFKSFTQNLIYSNAEFLKNFGFIEAGFQSGMGFRARIKAKGQNVLANPVTLAETFPISVDDRVTLQTVSKVVVGWTPRQNRRSEEAYKAELAEYLRSHGYPRTREEEGVSNPDILVDEKVPVEIKLNPDRSELNRLSGQLLDMKSEFGGVIACIIQTKGSLDLVERFQVRFRDDQQVVIIVKSA